MRGEKRRENVCVSKRERESADFYEDKYLAKKMIAKFSVEQNASSKYKVAKSVVQICEAID